MRNHYDFNGWGHDSGIVPQEWEPGQPPQPYGEVPGEKPGAEEPQSSRRTPDLWSRGRKKPPKPPKPPKVRTGGEKSREEKGVGGFFLLLGLILILVCVTLYFQGEVAGGEPLFREFWEEWGPTDYWDQRGEEPFFEEDWREKLKDTTVSRAPLDPGVTLTLTPAEETELTVQEIYQRVSPAVVGIRAVMEEGMALGTGIVMSSDGYVITDAHVIAGARKVSVILSDDSRKEALLVGYDGETDLAVLKIEGEELPVALFGDSAQLRVGDPAYAIGNPLGEELRGTMTDGIISAIDRTVAMNGQTMTLLQTTAALNSGNSGGALINAAGQVVGITNMKMMSDWETIEGLGFAVPTALAKEVVDQLIARGRYAGRPMLGITVYAVEAEGEAPAGLFVREVEPKSDAYRKGLRPGQIITAAQGESVLTTARLEELKGELTFGDTLILTVWSREGGTESFEVELMERTAFQ